VASPPNVFDPLFDEDVTRYADYGFRARRARLGYQAGCERLGISLWEIEPGSTGILHYHLANEELLVAMSGAPALQTAAGPRAMREGEITAFPRGPHGIHATGNPSDDPIRYLFISEMRGPDVIVYPEQGIVGVLEEMSSPEQGGMASWLPTNGALEHHDPEEPDPARAPAARPDSANLFEPSLEEGGDQPGYRSRGAELGRRAEAERIGASLYELEPGNSICPYHWHAANEELCVVIAGVPMLRTPDGERELAPGEVVAFPAGEAGAHKIAGSGDGPARILMVSEMNGPEIAVQPDSRKVLARQEPPGTPATGLRALFRLGDAVDYWEGELEVGGES
jgi:uncharacterized cupin superfamily protein